MVNSINPGEFAKDFMQGQLTPGDDRGLILCFVSDSLNYPQCYRIVSSFSLSGPRGAETIIKVIYFSLLVATLFMCPLMSGCKGVSLEMYKLPMMYKKWRLESAANAVLYGAGQGSYGGMPKSESRKGLINEIGSDVSLNSESEEPSSSSTRKYSRSSLGSSSHSSQSDLFDGNLVQIKSHAFLPRFP